MKTTDMAKALPSDVLRICKAKYFIRCYACGGRGYVPSRVNGENECWTCGGRGMNTDYKISPIRVRAAYKLWESGKTAEQVEDTLGDLDKDHTDFDISESEIVELCQDILHGRYKQSKWIEI